MTSDAYAAGIADPRAIVKVYGHNFESAHTLALAISNGRHMLRPPRGASRGNAGLR